MRTLDERKQALANLLDIDTRRITECGDNYYTVNGGEAEYLVLTEAEADRAEEDVLNSYLTDCVLSEIPEHLQGYFNCDFWLSDAKLDGRGHSLATYDGIEHEESIDGFDYLIYRTN